MSEAHRGGGRVVGKPGGRSSVGKRSAASGRYVTTRKMAGSKTAWIKAGPRPLRLAQATKRAFVYAGMLDRPQRKRRLREAAEIVAQVTDWAGGTDEAGRWFRAQPIPALGGRTAEAMVMSGQAALVREYLDHLSQGGHA